jgi:hypothetical protein
VPFEQETISRAVIALPGATKENSNFIVNNYTATLYTLARIFDVGNQLLRQSGGAAEQLVRSKLARAFALGEDHYALNGTGTSQPFGLLTAIGTSGDYVSTFSSPADNTVAGSVMAAVATAAGALETRGAIADGIVDEYRRLLAHAAAGCGHGGLLDRPLSARQPGPVPVRHSAAAHPEHRLRHACRGRVRVGSSSSRARATASIQAPRLVTAGTRT